MADGVRARRYRKTVLTKAIYEKDTDGGVIFRSPYRAYCVLFQLVRARMPARRAGMSRGPVRGVPVPCGQKRGGVPGREGLPRGPGLRSGVSGGSAELPAREVGGLKAPGSGAFFRTRYLAAAGTAFSAAFEAS